jgi:hypothetical protein
MFEIYFLHTIFWGLAVFLPPCDCHSTDRFVMLSDPNRGPRRLIIRVLVLNNVQININRPIMKGNLTEDDY